MISIRMPSAVAARLGAPIQSTYARHALAVCALLLILQVASVSAQGGCIARHSGSHYLRMSSSGFLIGHYTPYSDSSCSTVLQSDRSYGFHDGIAQSSSREAAIALCEERGPADEYRVARWVYDAPNIWFCGPVEQGSGDESNSKSIKRQLIQVVVGKSSDGAFTQATFTNRENLPLSGLKLAAFDGMNSGIQFRRLDAWYIGVQEVLDMGFLDGVDVWSNIGSGFEVCFPQAGRIVFVDAATSPREILQVRQEIRDGYTCASMDRAGQMVLVNGTGDADPDTHPASAASTRLPGTDDSIDDAIQLEGCVVMPSVNLLLRAAPWGTIMNVVPEGTMVVAQARTKSWFNVTYLDSDGWNAAWLLETEGNCAWTGDDAKPSALPAA